MVSLPCCNARMISICSLFGRSRSIFPNLLTIDSLEMNCTGSLNISRTLSDSSDISIDALSIVGALGALAVLGVFFFGCFMVLVLGVSVIDGDGDTK
jgi:hypothetical protein